MGATDVLTGIRILSGLLTLGEHALPVAQRVCAVIERAQAEQRRISADEWAGAITEADRADVHVAQAIAAAERAG